MGQGRFNIFSPVKLLEDLEQIATQNHICILVTLIDLYIKHAKSRAKSEDMKFDFYLCFGLTHILPL